jgi:hypothetical protein
LTLVVLMTATSVLAQNVKDLQYYRTPGKAGLNVFEPPKVTDVDFDGLYVRVGGDFSIIFQGLSQSNDDNSLIELSNNFALPSANLNFDVQIAEGMRMHLRTYLSSRHHTEAWVKGGYFQIDNLDFLSEGFLAEVMEYARFRFGMDEINYGDTHFRRSDNARSIYNPFVSNYIMDSFATEPFAEFSVQHSGVLGVVGISNGRLNQSPTSGDDGFAVFAKVGYDSQVNEDLRFRITGSVYRSSDKSTRDYLYNGDRAGSRYYNILETEEGGSDFEPRFNPGFAYQTAFQVNPFVKFQGLEVFGVLEVTSNGADAGGSFTQLGAEALYRFGAGEQFYVGGRYNTISGERTDDAATQEISRINIGGGWFLTDTVLAKVEYVTSSYDGAGFTGKYAGAEYDGIVLEAVINF